jgi:hypothetical protein
MPGAESIGRVVEKVIRAHVFVVLLMLLSTQRLAVHRPALSRP